jgi:biotin carboxylase
MPNSLITVLCLASYEKGEDLLRALKNIGCKVILVTVESLKDAPTWKPELIDELLWMPDLTKIPDVINGISFLARTHKIDRIITLDEFDIEIGSAIREHLRIPGMGDTTARYFRDKLAMRFHARDCGIRVPEFSAVINYDELREFMERVPPPYVLKPRTSASAIGITKIHHAEELWPILQEIGDEQSFKVLEKFIPGEIFHVDSVVSEYEVVFANVQKYGSPPLDVMHEGGIFSTYGILRGSEDELNLLKINRELIQAFKMARGVTHSEFIKGEDGEFYFLETAARVGGAYIAEVTVAARGINLWSEWGLVEVQQKEYKLPQVREKYAGAIISLARQEMPDTSAYTDPEIVHRIVKKNHVGLIVASDDPNRVKDVLESYTHRFYEDFHASAPVPDKPTA